MSVYDVAVLGGGPGGYVAAVRAAQRGAKVVLFEPSALGGVCLNIGCIPSKAWLNMAHLYRQVRYSESHGFHTGEVSLDFSAWLKRKERIIRGNRTAIEQLLKTYGITWVRETAYLEGPRTLRTNTAAYTAENIILALGSRPAALSVLPVDGKRVLDSSHALDLKELPERVVIVGGGSIGVEFASLWNAFGVDVTVVEWLPRLLPREDEELSAHLTQSLERKGATVLTACGVANAHVGSDTVQLELAPNPAFDNGALKNKPERLEADMVLVAVGRVPNTEALKDEAGRPRVALGSRGEVVVNEKMETSLPHVYAIGDVVAKTWLAHGASAEGLVAADNATGGHRTMDYRAVPRCTFSFPEVAAVGLTEAEARALGYPVRIGRFPFSHNGRAYTIGETEGLVKIVGEEKTDQVLGVHIMGPHAGELIALGAFAVQCEATVGDMAHTVFTHPTLSEAVFEAALDYYGESIHQPKRMERPLPASS
jgi:dihydrolipoamide dehydrogenase